MADNQAFTKEGKLTAIPGAFDTLTVPHLALVSAPAGLGFDWDSVSPAFVMQQSDGPGGPASWTDASQSPFVTGTSNSVNLTFPAGAGSKFFRLRQR